MTAGRLDGKHSLYVLISIGNVPRAEQRFSEEEPRHLVGHWLIFAGFGEVSPLLSITGRLAQMGMIFSACPARHILALHQATRYNPNLRQ